MTNQASEDELKKRIGNLHAYNYEGDDVTVKVMVDEYILESIAKFVEALIRTEKLKLLAEVRERVVGENQHSEHKEWDCPCGATHSFTEEWHATNRLRDEQRTALAKLEADL